jgi:hypothetical protein
MEAFSKRKQGMKESVGYKLQKQVGKHWARRSYARYCWINESTTLYESDFSSERNWGWVAQLLQLRAEWKLTDMWCMSCHLQRSSLVLNKAINDRPKRQQSLRWPGTLSWWPGTLSWYPLGFMSCCWLVQSSGSEGGNLGQPQMIVQMMHPCFREAIEVISK